ncbi:MAG TPA: hypothetical protein PLJ47_10025 [Candidatus Hydrogenedentes bacterium]|nr:hypothetical protein [Candidatus Hydrogenedentota bacterium]HRK34918.1 hypothetical protein [Candidatus Hydrogenedentota bacterium]
MHLWAAVRNVERNPLSAGLVPCTEEYRWSSVAAHCELRQDGLLSKEFPPPGAVQDRPEWLTNEDEADLRTCTRALRPGGTPSFIPRLESLLGRMLRQTARQ